MLARYVRQRLLNSRSLNSLNSRLLTWLAGGLLSVFVALQCPVLFGVLAIAGVLYGCFPSRFSSLTTHPQLKPFMTWKALGVSLGILLFVSITNHADPAMAQLIVVWVSAVGFIFFAVYQAQRGEQWQPLLQNAFIIIAAVVVVEGLSRLFFGGT
jgi:hypothetical protein